ncbi:unnamed protein product [Penicillium salamii]|uniref:Uncharacterized protein n=1 Tax=Penicillium salamii TaxID=1612424 RepID=A0A9W4IP82_9EURO|nr:unnamed protein product [Penicillium salamii]CAG8034647.1 unnamed protein product [Penicillium salamii]CAG8084540.1 unnamed protein product [Penicillium salamii]CAG8092508.1 unnamed protein product [Penicillium salamii]CAG8207867.1 unnamed protein product [Penicillium salamii]
MSTPKPDLPSLKTAEPATYPSQIHTPDHDIKREDESGTPIEVPPSYTEFIKTYTPIYTSPVSAGGFPKLSGGQSEPSPVSQPSTATSPPSSFGNSLKSPATPTISLPPPSPCTVKSAKAPPALRRLRIPQSLHPISYKDSPHTATPRSATPYSASPYSASPYSATPWSALPRSATSIRSSFSPTDWKLRYLEAPRSATGKAVSVRQVVTRTITYKRTPLDPPPKGKRRKTQECRDA